MVTEASMRSRHTPSFRVTSPSRVAIASACLIGATIGSAPAQVRRATAVNDTISGDTRRVEAALFGRDGYFLVAGGVTLHGNARFLLEQDGKTSAVPASAVTPIAEPGGAVALQAGTTRYQLAMPAGLACPLGRFVERDGLIAYTIVKYMNEASPHALLRAGVVHRRLAREFDSTPFEKLLRAADFAATEALPGGTGASIAADLNAQNGVGALVLQASYVTDEKAGSYVNSDAQVTYDTFLMPHGSRVEVAGVPLRYYWLLDNAGLPNVFSVEALAQNWPADARLTDWRAAGAVPTQYDIVNFYQVAAVLRELHLAGPAAFGEFVDNICKS
jgi:hypothetical protein